MKLYALLLSILICFSCKETNKINKDTAVMTETISDDVNLVNETETVPAKITDSTKVVEMNTSQYKEKNSLDSHEAKPPKKEVVKKEMEKESDALAEAKPDIKLISNPKTDNLLKKAREKLKEQEEAKKSSTQQLKEEKVVIESVQSNPSEPGKIDDKIIVPNKTTKIKKIEPEDRVAAYDHSLFDGLLKKHVSSKGVVDYAGFKADEANLDVYLKLLSDNSIQADWNGQKKLAYWLNAYNAYTIKLILKNYPVKSITDLHGGKPWKEKWIQLGGETYSLDQIENGIIRPEFNDARIHFALNCAAKSCPPLLNKAFKFSKLESDLNKLTSSFINNTTYNTLNESSASISKIFEWYKEDFGDIIQFLNKYSSAKLTSDCRINYNEYDWSLNGK